MSPPGHDRAAGLDAPNPLSLYLKRLAPSSQSTLRYVLQDLSLIHI